ncbi:MAG: hypothetical protein R2823_09780 [Acidimicrobiia bacterium]
MIAWTDTGTVAGFRLFVIVATMIVGGLATIATVVGFFGSVWWPFDYVANLRWYLLWVLLIASVIYALTAKGWLVVAMLVAMAANAFVLAPLWLGSQPDSIGESSLVVIHLDATGGFSDQEEATDWAAASDADVLLISGATTELVDEITATDGAWLVLLAPDMDNTAGQVVLARERWEVAVTPTGVGSDTVTRVTADGNGTTYDIVTALGPTASNAAKADRLAARLDTIRTIIDSASNPVIVIGNIGATRWTSGMRDLLSTTDLRDATEGYGYLSTSWASDLPLIGGWLGLPLDVVLMTPGVTPVELDTGPDVTARHLPVRVLAGPGS